MFESQERRIEVVSRVPKRSWSGDEMGGLLVHEVAHDVGGGGDLRRVSQCTDVDL